MIKINVIKFITLLSCFLAFTKTWANCPQPEELLLKMKGEWAARGTKTYPKRPDKIYLEAFTKSTMRDGILVVEETQKTYSNGVSNPPQIFTFNYWIRPSRTPDCIENKRQYEFGIGDASNNPRFLGYFDGTELISIEKLYAGMKNITTSTFFSDRVEVSSRLLQNDELMMTQELLYRRTDY